MLILAFGTNSALSYQFFPGFSSKWVPQYLIAIKHQRWWNTYTEYYMSPEVCESSKNPLLLTLGLWLHHFFRIGFIYHLDF